MKSITELQKETIGKLETVISNQANQISKLTEENHNLSQVLLYLTDSEFRDFCFKLNYNELINRFLENESNGQDYV